MQNLPKERGQVVNDPSDGISNHAQSYQNWHPFGRSGFTECYLNKEAHLLLCLRDRNGQEFLVCIQRDSRDATIGADARHQTRLEPERPFLVQQVADDLALVGTYSGSSTARTSTPDYAAQARATEKIRARREATTSLTGFLSSVVLRANTISPTQNVRGYVVFERDKNEHLVMLSGIVGNTIYQFPFLVAGR